MLKAVYEIWYIRCREKQNLSRYGELTIPISDSEIYG